MCRTLRFATPADVAVTPFDGGTVWDAPACREAWFAHRIELDHPPDRLDDGFARWDAAHAGKGVGRRYLAWETGLDTPWTELPPRFAPVRVVGMRRPPGSPPRSSSPLPIAATAPDRVARYAAREHPAFGGGYTRYVEWLYAGLAARGATVFAALDGEDVVASATVVPGPDAVRFQEVWTTPRWRRQGLAAALVATALAQYPDRDAFLAAEDGGPAVGIYLRAGFVAVSRVTEVSTESDPPP